MSVPIIPRVLHQIWFQGQDDIPRPYKDFQDTWRILENRGWRYKLWDKCAIETVTKSNHYFWDIYVHLTSMIEKIDFAKFVILYTEGGVYVDMDSYLLPDREKDFEDTFRTDKTWMICEHNVSRMSIHLNVLVGLKSTQILLNNALVASERNCPVMLKIIKRIQKASTNPLISYVVPSQFRCLYTTGPNMVTNVVRTVTDWRSYVIDKYVFEPFHPIKMKEIHKMLKSTDNTTTSAMMDRLYSIIQKDPSLSKITLAVHMGDLNWVQEKKQNKIIQFFEKLCSLYEDIITTNNHS